MYIPALPKESASVRKDESMDSALTPYARYESMDSAKGKGMNSILIKYLRHEEVNLRHEEVKRIFENLAQLFLLSNDEKNIASVDLLIPKKSFIVWENSQNKSGDAPSKTDNLDSTTTDKQPVQTVYRFSIALSKANNRAIDRQPIQTVLNRLMELLQEEEECDISKPTEYSFTTAWKLVNEASQLRGKYFQKATVSTDDEGGIRLRWRNPNKDREVRLYCPANTTKKMYIYHEEGDSYNAEFNVSGRTLAEWLYWLSDA